MSECKIAILQTSQLLSDPFSVTFGSYFRISLNRITLHLKKNRSINNLYITGTIFRTKTVGQMQYSMHYSRGERFPFLFSSHIKVSFLVQHIIVYHVIREFLLVIVAFSCYGTGQEYNDNYNLV